MPEKKTIERAKKASGRQSPSTQAGEFVREEIDHIRHGEHGARSTKQAIAIGLSKARRAGVELPQPKQGRASEETRKQARATSQRSPGSRKKTSAKRSRAAEHALKDQSTRGASSAAFSRHARRAPSRRSPGHEWRRPRRACTNAITLSEAPSEQVGSARTARASKKAARRDEGPALGPSGAGRTDTERQPGGTRKARSISSLQAPPESVSPLPCSFPAMRPCPNVAASL